MICEKIIIYIKNISITTSTVIDVNLLTTQVKRFTEQVLIVRNLLLGGKSNVLDTIFDFVNLYLHRR